MGIDLQLTKKMYQTMWEIRYFEEKAGQLFSTRVLKKGGVHPCIGQEAIPVGVCLALRQEDWITSTHRGHGHHVAKGADLGRLMSELLGREDGYCHGRGGSMHVAAFDVGSLGAYAVVGEGVPIGVGAALSEHLRGSDRVVASFFGDGALGQGVTHEAFNLASIWNLPVVFVCENNGIAVSSHTAANIAAASQVDDLARVHNIEGHTLDGQDVLQVYRAAKSAVEKARRGAGPTLLNCRTYRFEGHYFSEPQVYRSREEKDEMRRNHDPLTLFADYLANGGILSPGELDELRQAAWDRIEACAEFAQESSEPDPESYGSFVYA